MRQALLNFSSHMTKKYLAELADYFRDAISKKKANKVIKSIVPDNEYEEAMRHLNNYPETYEELKTFIRLTFPEYTIKTHYSRSQITEISIDESPILMSTKVSHIKAIIGNKWIVSGNTNNMEISIVKK